MSGVKAVPAAAAPNSATGTASELTPREHRPLTWPPSQVSGQLPGGLAQFGVRQLALGRGDGAAVAEGVGGHVEQQ